MGADKVKERKKKRKKKREGGKEGMKEVHGEKRWGILKAAGEQPRHHCATGKLQECNTPT